ncbi:MAG: hypothetical protein IMW89_14860 [Ktedonobacteraceae bacterium]|nr:hypothetical protein [Ktedonobacteraceae bacterium]
MSTRATSHITSSFSASALLLHRSLQLDALTSLVGAAGFLAVGLSPLAQIMGFTEPALPLIVGVVLLAYVGWLFWLTRRPDAQPRQALLVIAINDCWVVGWLAVLIFNLLPLTLLGKLFVGLMVVIVALFALVEFYAIRKMRTE